MRPITSRRPVDLPALVIMTPLIIVAIVAGGLCGIIAYRIVSRLI